MVDVGVALTSLTSSMFALHGRHGQRCGADKKVRVGRLLVHRFVVVALVPQSFGSFLLKLEPFSTRGKHSHSSAYVSLKYNGN